MESLGPGELSVPLLSYHFQREAHSHSRHNQLLGKNWLKPKYNNYAVTPYGLISPEVLLSFFSYLILCEVTHRDDIHLSFPAGQGVIYSPLRFVSSPLQKSLLKIFKNVLSS